MTLQGKKILLICSYYKIVTMNKMWKECHKLKNMINISKNYRKMQFIWMRVMFFVAIIVGFMMPGMIKIDDGEKNFYTIYLNESKIGATDSRDTIDEVMARARRIIAGESTDLIYAKMDLEVESERVLFGKIDSERTLLNRVAGVLQENSIQTLQRAYTVKVNEYSVNLASSDEVKELLNAALNKYDTKDEYSVELVLDPTRELHVLTAQINKKEEKEEEEKEVFWESGVEKYLDDIFKSMEPEVERAFENYDYGLQSMGFAEKVEIGETFLLPEELTPLDEAIEQVTKDKEVNEIYEVVAGDTLSGIVEKVNIPMDKIIELNDAIKDERSTLHIGQEIIITVPEPELSVVRTEQLYLEEAYDADIIYVDNDDWYTTQEKTLQEPSTGFRKAVANITYRNDKEISKEVVKEVVLMEAVPKIVERGTKIPPTFIKPISGGRLTSRFGRRTSPTRGASSNHKGVDWGIPRGSSVVASSGGTVTKAGWGGGYGYVVYIKHPGGAETRYAHCSKVLVSVGQTVKQGQRIALTGNTGVSTGPHLHFELRLNGTPVDPYAYME